MNLEPRNEQRNDLRLSFGEMMEKLYVEKHTGPVIVHFAQGRPNHIEIPAAPTRFVLDKR